MNIIVLSKNFRLFDRYCRKNYLCPLDITCIVEDDIQRIRGLNNFVFIEVWPASLSHYPKVNAYISMLSYQNRCKIVHHSVE